MTSQPANQPTAADNLELTRDLIGDTSDVYALRVKGTGFTDALINDGDIVILRRGVDVKDGDMVTATVKSQGRVYLRRIWRDGGRVQLRPEDPARPVLSFDAADVTVKARVIAVIRNEAALHPTPAPAPVEAVQAEQAPLFETPRPAWNVPADRGKWKERARNKWARHDAALGRE